MNKKGFTLVELLAVVAIMAVLSLIAVPNVVNMLDRGKKEQFIEDAKEIISKAEYQLTLDQIKVGKEYSISTFGYSNKTDGYGDYYDATNSKVTIIKQYNKYVFKIKLITPNHCLGTSSSCGFVTDEDLENKGIELVIDV